MNQPSLTKNNLLLDRLAFWVLLGSGAFIILLWSNNVLGKHLGLFAKKVIYLLPLFLLFLSQRTNVIKNQELRLKIILIISIIIMGIVNIILSDNVSKSSKIMQEFLCTGVTVTWIAMFVLNNNQRLKVFNWFCCIILAIITTVETINFLINVFSPWISKPLTLGFIIESICYYITFTWELNIFTHNPIPLGTLVILLSIGPLQLIVTNNRKQRYLGWTLIILGLILILLTQKRSTYLVVLLLALAWVIFLHPKILYLCGVAFLIGTLLTSFWVLPILKSLDPKNKQHFSILCRLELYNFARHVIQKNPFFGTGIRSFTLEKYLVDYQTQNHDLDDMRGLNAGFNHKLYGKELLNFGSLVTILQTFDNMFITLFTELGSFLTIFYLWLIFSILIRYCRTVRPFVRANLEEFLRLLPIFGFLLHSLAYDSMLFPQINWLFHVQLGILAGYPVSPPIIQNNDNDKVVSVGK